MIVEKPKVKLVGQNGNVFNLIGICTRALKEVGYYDQAKEMQKRVFACGSYDQALCVLMEYCEVE